MDGRKKFRKAELRSRFGERTFGRGYDYFKEGYVVTGIKFRDKIWGQVAGSRPQPYKVSVKLDDEKIKSNCSCPVGYMCKHGVALALQWTEEPESFVDAREIIENLKGRSREELVVMLENIIHSNPVLVHMIDSAMQKAEAGREKINLKALERRISYAVSGDLDYYHISGAVGELWDIYEFADTLQEKSRFKDAAEVFLRLVEGCTWAYEIGADDSNGAMGDLAHECASMFNESLEKVDDQGFKDAMLMRVAELYEREDYGIETEDMFLGLVTDANIGKIENELNRQLKNYLKEEGHGDGFLAGRKRAEVKDILTRLYERIGRIEDALSLSRSDMGRISDYVDLADILVRAGRHDEALETLRECPEFKDSEKGQVLAHAYLRVVEALMQDGHSERIDVEEAVESAAVLIASVPWSFNSREYERLKSIFQKLDAEERFFSKVKGELAGTSSLAELLLHENDIAGAAGAWEGVEKTTGELAIGIAAKAKSKGLEDIAMRMTLKALRTGFFRLHFGLADDALQLVSELLSRSSSEELEDIVSNLRVDEKLSSFIAEELATKSPGLVRLMVGDNIEAYEFAGLMRIVEKLVKSSPTDARDIGDIWISEFVVRSHVYYDDAL
ncbi:MAG: SWIM zinc finger domain-containing protein, partial [Thermoplasmata archaeon]